MEFKIIGKQPRRSIRKAEKLIRERFWNFHSKLVEEHPQYAPLFDYVVGNAHEGGVLWEVLEFAQYHLDSDIQLKGINNITVSNYKEALEYGYSEWFKQI